MYYFFIFEFKCNEKIWHPMRDPECIFPLESLDLLSYLKQDSKQGKRPIWIQNKTLVFVGDVRNPIKHITHGKKVFRNQRIRFILQNIKLAIICW